MEGGIEDETAGAFECRSVAAWDRVLLQDERLEALAGESGGAAQPAEARSDDDGVPGLAGGGAGAVPGSSPAPISAWEGILV